MKIENPVKISSEQALDLLIYYAMKSKHYEHNKLYKVLMPDATAGEIFRSAFFIRLALGIPEPFNGNY